MWFYMLYYTHQMHILVTAVDVIFIIDFRMLGIPYLPIKSQQCNYAFYNL